jgi:hypothetical protein
MTRLIGALFMRKFIAHLVLSLAALAACHPSVRAGLVFTKIADTSTAIPGGSGTFSSVDGAAIDGNTVLLNGIGAGGQYGAYMATIGGSLSTVADTNTAIPGGTGNFSTVAGTTISGNTVTFFGSGSGSQSGIYTSTGGTLDNIVDKNTLIPDGTGHFTGFIGYTSSGSTVAFGASGMMGQSGIYTSSGGVLTVVADRNTLIPSGTGKFTNLDTLPSISGSTVAFEGRGSNGQSGIYTSTGGTLAVVADTNTTAPGGSGTFTGFGTHPEISGNTVVFGASVGSVQGIYADGSGGLTLLADTNTASPNGNGSFVTFLDLAVSGQTVAFVAQTGEAAGATYGLYVENLDGTGLTEVIEGGRYPGREDTHS